jgi:hypothetical protein
MSTLWTPDGEHRVPRPDETGAGAGGPSRPGAPGSSGGSGGRPPARGDEGDDRGASSQDETATEEELVELARQLAAAPAEDVIANHCYGLFELAALHLSQQPPQLEKARLAIDALGLLVDGLGERLGQHAEALVDGLSQLRLAFVKIAGAGPAADGQGAAAP